MSAPEQRPQPRPGIMKIARYVGGEGDLPGIDDPIRLAANESALGPSPKAVAAYAAARDSLHRYADGGAAELRRALGARHGIDPERIVVGNGSDEIISLLAKAYAGPGDEVLFSRHGFAMYPIATLAAGATPVMAPETGYRADVDAMLERVGERTKIVFLANPNNPTGSYVSAAEAARLHAGLPPHVLLVIDAAYAEYVTRNDYTDGLELARKHENVAMMRTFSKIYGLAALRVGWCFAAPAVCDVLHRTRGPFNVNMAAQAAALAALDDVGHIDRARAHNDIWLPWFAEQLEQLGLTVLPSIGNFVLVGFPAEEGRNAAAAEARLKGDGIIPRPVGGYGLPDFLRITVGLEDEMRATVASLRAFVGR